MTTASEVLFDACGKFSAEHGNCQIWLIGGGQVELSASGAIDKLRLERVGIAAIIVQKRGRRVRCEEEDV